MTTFTGIPLAALDFYEDLEADNSKVWWAAHKDVYESSVRTPMTALMTDLEDEFGTGKIFRPHRDVRFSKDKAPYKTHQGAFIGAAPSVGYYVQIAPDGLFVAGGFYAATPDGVNRYRIAVDDEVRGAELQRIVADLQKSKFDIGGDILKTKPRGYDIDHPRIDLLRHKSLTAGIRFGSPKWLETPRAAKEVRTAWRKLGPLIEWSAQVIADGH